MTGCSHRFLILGGLLFLRTVKLVRRLGRFAGSLGEVVTRLFGL